MYLSQFVSMSVCLSVNVITQKVADSYGDEPGFHIVSLSQF